MAFIQCNFFSEALGKCCGMNVVIPQPVGSGQIGIASASGRTLYPVLYLLHGLSDDYTIWMRRTSIERYAAARNLVIVMPDGGRSFYTDMKFGGKYWTFLSEELPKLVCGFFPVSPAREDTFVAGLSMGGYGALKLALRRPDRFAAAGALSAVTDINTFLTRIRETPGSNGEGDFFFGPVDRAPDADDLFVLSEQCAALPAAQRPKLTQFCGTEDFLYQDNVRFRDHMQRLGAFDYRYFEAPGSHTWEFWDTYIQEILAWLPLR